MDCHCGLPAAQKVSGPNAKNPNKPFLTCATKSCDFFKFVGGQSGGGGNGGNGGGWQRKGVNFKVQTPPQDDALKLAVEANTLAIQCLTNATNRQSGLIEKWIEMNKKKSAYDELVEKERPRKRQRTEPQMPPLESQEDPEPDIEKLNS